MADFKALLNACDSEPIHLSGAIQEHGFIIATDSSDRIVWGSINSDDFLRSSIEALIGLNIQEIPAWHTLRENKDFVLREHILPDGRIYEITHSSGEESGFEYVRQISRAISQTKNTQGLYDAITHSIQKLTDYDRIMLYQFAEDWSGSVVSETLKVVSSTDTPRQIDSFLNLRFPAEDIPSQARALYAHTLVRSIPNVGYKAIPIYPESVSKTVDLSDCILRSVSPIHIEYLHNMRVGASTSISIIINDKLWGLIACHNEMPSLVDSQKIELCETVAPLFAHMIATALLKDSEILRAESRALQVDLLRKLALSNDIVAGLIKYETDLLKLGSASSAAIVTEDNVYTIGDAPSVNSIRSVVDWLNAMDVKDVYATNCLPKEVNLGGLVSGLLATRLRGSDRRWFIWFRPEIISETNWAGDPHKDFSKQEELHPRRSFSIYKETVRGRCQPWNSETVETTKELCEYVGLRLDSESQFNTVLEASTDAIFIVDTAGDIKQSNLKFRQLVKRVFIDDQDYDVKALLPSASATDTIALKNGEQLPIEVSYTPLNTPEGLFTLVSITDVTDRKLIEQERELFTAAIADSNDKLRQFTDTISHDLKAPLSAIANLATWVESDLGDQLQGAAKENLQLLIQRTGKMKTQLSDLLEYSRAGQLRAEREKVDVEELIRSLWFMLPNSARYKLKTSDLPELMTVKAPLEHVFYNLLENATKHAENPGSYIRVFSQKEGAHYLFSVQDEGRGIEQSLQEQIFEPMRSFAVNKEESHGMGLAFVKRIVEQTGGEISVESQPNEGTTFTFSWNK